MAPPPTSDDVTRGWRPQLVLRTKLGRRFVTLFVLCALVPVAVFGLLADRAVSAELRTQALERVRRGGKDAGTSILQQFTLLDEQLSTAIRASDDGAVPVLHDPRALRVETNTLAALSRAERERVRSGKPQLRVSFGTGAATLQLVRWAPLATDSTRIALLTLNLRRVIGGVSGLDLVPPASVLCTTVANAALGCVKAIDSDVDGETPIEATSRVFLRYAFAAPELLITVAEADEVAFAPLQRFRALFVPVALSALCLAALLAQVTIRRQTAPLAALDAGTRRIAAGDFAHQVAVDSDDEFGQLAGAFNGMTRQLNRLVDELRALNTGALEALARTTDAASPWTAGHSVRVTAIAVALARADGLDDDTVDLVRRGALLHDIGKLAVPVAILDKPAALTEDERKLMNTHPDVGARILQPIAAFEPLLPMVRSHHERWDGTGYPDRLRGEAIHPLARLLAVADVAESMLAARPYRNALPVEYVVEFIRENAGKHFDPHFAHLFATRVLDGDAGLRDALMPSAGAVPDARLREVA